MVMERKRKCRENCNNLTFLSAACRICELFAIIACFLLAQGVSLV